MAAMYGCGIQSSRPWQNEERLRDDVSLNCAYRISPGLVSFDLGLGATLFHAEDDGSHLSQIKSLIVAQSIHKSPRWL